MCMESFVRACRARTDPFPGQTLHPSIPHVILLRDIHNRCGSFRGPWRGRIDGALHESFPFEAHLPFLRSVLAKSSRPLPLVHHLRSGAGRVGGSFAAAPPGRPRRVASGDAVNPVLSLPFQRPGAASITSDRTAAHRHGRDPHAGFASGTAVAVNGLHARELVAAPESTECPRRWRASTSCRAVRSAICAACLRPQICSSCLAPGSTEMRPRTRPVGCSPLNGKAQCFGSSPMS